MTDIRWKQRFDNFLRAFATLSRAVDLAHSRELSELEQQGLIQSFEFTHELAWNVLKDYLADAGFTDIVGSKDATRQAFKTGLIRDGDVWMAMIRNRNLTSHTYNLQTAHVIAKDIVETFYPAFKGLAQDFAERAAKEQS